MKLTAKARSKIPTSEFAGPGRSYPIENKSHARNAISRATQQYDSGRLSKAAEEHIIGKARRKLGQ